MFWNGKRYANVTKEVKDYVRGLYGRSPVPVSAEIRHQIIGDETPIDCRPADMLEPSYERMKAEAEKAGLVKKEEDVLTYIMYLVIAPCVFERRPPARTDPRADAGRRACCRSRWHTGPDGG